MTTTCMTVNKTTRGGASTGRNYLGTLQLLVETTRGGARLLVENHQGGAATGRHYSMQGGSNYW